MRLLKKVSIITVKKCFVAAQYIKKQNQRKTRYLPKLEKDEFIERLESSKKYVAKMPEKKLNKFIKDEYPKRLKVYDSVDWYEAYVSPNEIGVWKGAGGLPISWTKNNLAETAKLVKQGIDRGDKRIAARAGRAIPRMFDLLGLIEKERYLYPIIVSGGMMGRKGLKLMKGDIDDGNMRAIALTISGRKKIKAFVGIPKK